MISLQFEALFKTMKESFDSVIGSSNAEGIHSPYASPSGKMERAVIWRKLNGATYKVTIERKKTK